MSVLLTNGKDCGLSLGETGSPSSMPLIVSTSTETARSSSASIAEKIIQGALALGHIQQRMKDIDWSRKIGALLPTLTAQDAKNNAGPAQYDRNTFPMNVIAGGKLNPRFCEWMMGYSDGWTQLDA